MGFGIVQLRSVAAAEGLVRHMHDTVLEGQPLFLRQDVEVVARDKEEASPDQQEAAWNANSGPAPSLLEQLCSWVLHAPPLVNYGWSEGFPSVWAPPRSMAGAMTLSTAADASSFEWAQLASRMLPLIPSRTDASTIPAAWERTYGQRLEVRVYGFSSLREILSAMPSLQLQMVGSRLLVEPTGIEGGAAGPADTDRKRQRPVAPSREREREERVRRPRR
mmetsp:Transcript_44607/g.94856  ORF Transcript_44607/g.94856 Transcript_44607/m.94856 type:complete len:220 (-) Transcript_44607:527-1186(-)